MDSCTAFTARRLCRDQGYTICWLKKEAASNWLTYELHFPSNGGADHLDALSLNAAACATCDPLLYTRAAFNVKQPGEVQAQVPTQVPWRAPC